MKQYIFIWILLTVVFTSCEKDVNLKLPEPPAKLAVHALWERDSVFEVAVTRSYNISETPRLGPGEWPEPQTMLKRYSVTNAKVTVYRNNQPYDELQYNPDLYKYQSASGKKATEGASYSVKVESPGFNPAQTAMYTFPPKVVIQSIEVRRDVTRDENGNKMGEVVLTFNDPLNEKNYYWLYFERKYRTQPGTYLMSDFYVTPLDKDVVVPVGDVVNDIANVRFDRVILKDDNFNGQTKKLVLRLPSWILEGLTGNGALEFSVQLRNVSEDVFKYVRSRVIDTENPFSSPVQAYSNIQSGLGIFGLFAGDKKVL